MPRLPLEDLELLVGRRAVDVEVVVVEDGDERQR